MIRVALLLDNCTLTKWEKQALDYADDCISIELILSCTNTRTKKNFFNNFAYYFLNLISLRGGLAKRTAYPHSEIKIIEFESIYDGSWQKIPDEILTKVIDSEITVIIKFGMSLMRVDGVLSELNILSYHHGDPTEFRGRPAGFYELLFKKAKVGTVIQSITNKLDAGCVWAISHTKIFDYSYKKTVERLYCNSKYLLRKAIINLENGRPVDISGEGVNFRLPSNLLVLKFAFILFSRKFKRFLYGIFYEKKWNVLIIKNYSFLMQSNIKIKDFQSPIIKKPYLFYADPFFASDGTRLCIEAMKGDGKGDLIEIDRDSYSIREILFSGNHYSYPYVFNYLGKQYLMPEVASHSAPFFVSRDSCRQQRTYLKGLGMARIVDATLFHKDNLYYLFFGFEDTAADSLYLYYSDSIDGEFKPHKLNPIIVDPERARMAGSIVVKHDKIYRLGQNNSFSYGNGITVAEILSLSPDYYDERIVHRISYDDASGPHTLNLCKSDAVLDYYVDKFTVLAGFRRLAALFTRKNPHK
jgi:hypothetical protein